MAGGKYMKNLPLSQCNRCPVILLCNVICMILPRRPIFSSTAPELACESNSFGKAFLIAFSFLLFSLFTISLVVSELTDTHLHCQFGSPWKARNRLLCPTKSHLSGVPGRTPISYLQTLKSTGKDPGLKRCH